jgi:hypothetical protein
MRMGGPVRGQSRTYGARAIPPAPTAGAQLLRREIRSEDRGTQAIACHFGNNVTNRSTRSEELRIGDWKPTPGHVFVRALTGGRLRNVSSSADSQSEDGLRADPAKDRARPLGFEQEKRGMARWVEDGVSSQHRVEIVHLVGNERTTCRGRFRDRRAPSPWVAGSIKYASLVYRRSGLLRA